MPDFLVSSSSECNLNQISGGAALTEALAMAYVNPHFGKEEKMPKPNRDR